MRTFLWVLVVLGSLGVAIGVAAAKSDIQLIFAAGCFAGVAAAAAGLFVGACLRDTAASLRSHDLTRAAPEAAPIPADPAASIEAFVRDSRRK